MARRKGAGNRPAQFRPESARERNAPVCRRPKQVGIRNIANTHEGGGRKQHDFFTRASRIRAMHGRVRPPQRTSEKFARLPQNRCEVLPESVRGVIFPETHRKKAGGRCTFGIIREKPGTPLQILPGLRTATAKRTHAGTGGNAATM